MYENLSCLWLKENLHEEVCFNLSISVYIALRLANSFNFRLKPQTRRVSTGNPPPRLLFVPSTAFSESQLGARCVLKYRNGVFRVFDKCVIAPDGPNTLRRQPKKKWLPSDQRVTHGNAHSHAPNPISFTGGAVRE